jgi:hypothetical protein
MYNHLAHVAPGMCTVPVEILERSPYNLPCDSSVRARVICYNQWGKSPWSEVGNKATIPCIPNSPPLECEPLTKTSVSLSWSEPVNYGGSPIISYEITQQKIGVD